MLKVTLWVLAALAVVAGALFALAYARTDTYLGRWFAWRASDVSDVQRFDSRPIQASTQPQPFSAALRPLGNGRIAYTWRGSEREQELGTLLEETGTSAFVVINDGVVATEWYGPGHTRDAQVTSFSVAKSVTALLVMAAVEDGLIRSLDDSLTAYLPELREVDAGYDSVTLRHLLDMRSGIRFRDHDLPWGDKARVYYEPHLRELVMTLPLVAEPGMDFAYNSYNPVLLGLVLERATGMEPARYLEQRLWQPLGAEYAATWSVSRAGETLPKMESGINAAAIDFVKLGVAMLEGAVPGGPVQLVENLRAEAELIDPAQSDGLRYGLGWWVYPATYGRSFAVAGTGHLGQYLFVYPDEGVVIARFGERFGDVDSWRVVFDQVVGLSVD